MGMRVELEMAMVMTTTRMLGWGWITDSSGGAQIVDDVESCDLHIASSNGHLQRGFIPGISCM